MTVLPTNIHELIQTSHKIKSREYEWSTDRRGNEEDDISSLATCQMSNRVVRSHDSRFRIILRAIFNFLIVRLLYAHPFHHMILLLHRTANRHLTLAHLPLMTTLTVRYTERE